jgi:hypothetical protein
VGSETSTVCFVGNIKRLLNQITKRKKVVNFSCAFTSPG